jgi:hypothetical protein
MKLIESTATLSFKRFIFLADFKVSGTLTIQADDYFCSIGNDGLAYVDHYPSDWIGTQTEYDDHSAFQMRKDAQGRDIKDCFPFTYDLPLVRQPHLDLTLSGPDHDSFVLKKFLEEIKKESFKDVCITNPLWYFKDYHLRFCYAAGNVTAEEYSYLYNIASREEAKDPVHAAYFNVVGNQHHHIDNAKPHDRKEQSDTMPFSTEDGIGTPLSSPILQQALDKSDIVLIGTERGRCLVFFELINMLLNLH